MSRANLFGLFVLVSAIFAAFADDPKKIVGPATEAGQVVTTGQYLRPAGEQIQISGRPVDLACSPDGATVFVKDNRGLVVIDARDWRVKQELGSDSGGGSMHGITISKDGERVYVTTSGSHLLEAKRGKEGTFAWSRKIEMKATLGGASFPCGVALADADAQNVAGTNGAAAEIAYVCLSRNNSLAEVDIAAGKVLREIAVGVAPYAVVLHPGGKRAFVSCWGGRRPKESERTAMSSGTAALCDERGVASSGTVACVRLDDGAVEWEIEVGLQPNDLVMSRDGERLFVANGNSDTVALIDTAAGKVTARIDVKPDAALPYGSMPSGLALSEDEKTLYVANGGNNAIAVVALDTGGGRVRGFIPAGWFPGALSLCGDQIFVANVKGIGSRTPREGDGAKWNSHWHRGTIGRIRAPNEKALTEFTATVKADALVPQILQALDKGDSNVPPTPVPARVGEPSPIEHVVYIIKENRTYDQMFGDLPRGNNDPSLCIFGREITPNHHALAEEFVQLDNYYCGGVLSADGHSWATEGNVTGYLEKSFGGFSRSYTFGDDPLTYSASGFVWDAVLARGLSFRNYGEMHYTHEKPDMTYDTMYREYYEAKKKLTIESTVGIDTLKRYSCGDYPGWNMDIPDVLRAEVFLAELKEAEAKGVFPNFTIIYLPNDHTEGTSPGAPTPRSYLAENDLALGRIVEALSRSRFWPKMCIFVNEDDPQDGFDHVDGHRSICLVISPYAKRGALVSDFYNQSSVVHTICRILGAPALNQLNAAAPVMTACFTATADLTPFTCRPNGVPLNELNPKKSALKTPAEQYWAAKSESLDLSKPDAIDDDTMNRILWHAMKGTDAAYPAELSGAHGRGLAALGLRLDERGIVDEDRD